jgi:hypothetical protein
MSEENNECLKAIAARIGLTIGCIKEGKEEDAVVILMRLQSILPKPEVRHIDSALVELQK